VIIQTNTETLLRIGMDALAAPKVFNQPRIA
jgi:hypothetical protein